MEETQLKINTTFINSLVKRFKVIGLDGDWTVWQPKVGQGKNNVFRKTPSDVRWMPGRKEVLQALYKRGMHLYIATNQGLTPYLPTEEEAEQFIKEHLTVSQELVSEIGPEVKVYHCFTFPQTEKTKLAKYVMENDFMRKPNPGMLLAAMSDFEIANVKDALFVGDMRSDEQAATNASIEFMGADAFFEQAYRQDKSHTSDMAMN